MERKPRVENDCRELGVKLRKYTNIFSGLTDAGVETVNHCKEKAART